LFFCPILNVFLGQRAAALAFAGVFEFAGMVVGFASTQGLALIVPGAIVDLRHLLGGSNFARRDVSRSTDNGIRSVSITLPDGSATQQTGHGGGQDLSGYIFHRVGHFNRLIYAKPRLPAQA
jgi:hypothetical protein